MSLDLHLHGTYIGMGRCLGAICGIITVATSAPDFTKPSAKGFTNIVSFDSLTNRGGISSFYR